MKWPLKGSQWFAVGFALEVPDSWNERASVCAYSHSLAFNPVALVWDGIVLHLCLHLVQIPHEEDRKTIICAWTACMGDASEDAKTFHISCHSCGSPIKIWLGQSMSTLCKCLTEIYDGLIRSFSMCYRKCLSVTFSIRKLIFQWGQQLLV